MSRVFWDAMLFIYLLEGNEEFAPAAKRALARSRQRQDTLLTSYLSLAEALVGMPQATSSEVLHSAIEEMGFTFVAFERESVEAFRLLRRDYGLKQPDSMHLACAASAKTDLFLTGDGQLLKKHLVVPGIQFISDFRTPPF